MSRSGYDRIHRFLLRSLAGSGVLTVRDAEEVVKNFAGNQNFNIRQLIEEINEQIRPIKQTIKLIKDETTSDEVLVFMSLAHDSATKSQNLFHPSELEYFRVLLEQIMSSDSRQITGIHALNSVNTMITSFTKTAAQKMLDTWCRMKYLEKEQTNYVLGVRTIHEFEGYFRENMPDIIEECCLCKQIVYRGYNCIGCAKAVHTWCLNKYTAKFQKWPCCKVDFNPDDLEKNYGQSSRYSQSQVVNSRNDVTMDVEPSLDSSEEMTQEISTQDVIPEISQRIPRKRKKPPT